MPNVEYSIQRQYEHWSVSVLKAIKEMQLFNVIELRFVALTKDSYRISMEIACVRLVQV